MKLSSYGRGEHDVIREALRGFGSTQFYEAKHCAEPFRKVNL